MASLAASEGRREAAAQRVAAVQKSQQTLDVKAGRLERVLEEFAGQAGFGGDPQLTELAGRISMARRNLANLAATAKPAGATPLAGLDGMLRQDRNEDERRQVKAEIKALGGQIAGLVESRRKRLCELLRADSEAGRVVAEWERLLVEMAAQRIALLRAQAARARVFSEEGVYGQGLKASLAPFPADAPVVDIHPPADAISRMARFQSRNSPEAIQELGEQFFAQMTLDRPDLGEIRKLVEARKFGPALDAYKMFFFSRLAAEEAAGGGVDAQRDGEVSSISRFAIPVNAQKVEMAMAGYFIGNVADEPGKIRLGRVKLGQPGAIPWVFASGESGWQLPFCQQLGNPVELGAVLRSSYQSGGPREHLVRWSEILDDWAMNWPQDVEKSPLPIRNYFMLTVCRLEGLRDILANCARARPSFVEDLPSTTLARLLMLTNQEYLSSAIRLGRCGLYNLRIMALNSMVPVSLQMQEFHAHQWALREGWRQVDNNFVYKIRRDGANFEFANEGHEDTDQSMLGNMEKLRTWQAQPSWLEPFWDEEFLENFLSNTRYRVSNLKQDGYCYRLSTRIQTLRFSGENPLYKINLLADELEVNQRLWSVFGIGQPQDIPQISSEALPFQGYYYLRGGWKRDDYFLYFQSIGQPILSGREDNTGFMLYNHGRSLLLAPAITVDGRVQNVHFASNEKSGGKSHYASYGLPDAVKTGRFLGGRHFDFCEGTFEGVCQYARPSAFFYPFGTYDWLTARSRAEKDAERAGEVFDDAPVKDVSQSRQVLAVKGRNLFIVTDTVRSENLHRYTQYYTVYTPVRNDRPKERLLLLRGASLGPLEINEANRTLKTRNVGLANLGMAHFSSFPVGYSVSWNGHERCLKEMEKNDAPKAVFAGLTKRESQELAINNEVLLNQKVAVRWEGKGTQLLVTLLATARPSHEVRPPDVLRDVQSLRLSGEAAGFSGRYADGTPVYYVAQAKPADLEVGSLKAKASTLLLSGKQGVALDCTEIGGMMPELRDFTFHLDGGAVVVDEPIYRPIQPVVIDPAVNVFTEFAKVTLSCATPGVEIRYTLDGSKPVPQSQLYSGPIKVEETCRLKARAFRSGVTQDVWQTDGTLATVVYSAVLRKEVLAPAIPELQRAPRPGMAYEYFEGPWPTLMARSLDMPAKKEGVVADVLDVSPRETQGAFGIRYVGFLDVQADGVYTLHAPREYTFPDVDCGYELRVFVNGREWNPAVRWQGHGEWSVALRKGKHAFEVAYVDTRSNPRKIEFVWGFPDPSFTWSGTAPSLSLSGPGLKKGPIPAKMLFH